MLEACPNFKLLIWEWLALALYRISSAQSTAPGERRSGCVQPALPRGSPMGAARALMKCWAPGTWLTAPRGSVKCLKYPGRCSSSMGEDKISECQPLPNPSSFPKQDFRIQAQTPCSANFHLDTYTPSPHMQTHTHRDVHYPYLWFSHSCQLPRHSSS